MSTQLFLSSFILACATASQQQHVQLPHTEQQVNVPTTTTVDFSSFQTQHDMSASFPSTSSVDFGLRFPSSQSSQMPIVVETQPKPRQMPEVKVQKQSSVDFALRFPSSQVPVRQMPVVKTQMPIQKPVVKHPVKTHQMPAAKMQTHVKPIGPEVVPMHEASHATCSTYSLPQIGMTAVYDPNCLRQHVMGSIPGCVAVTGPLAAATFNGCKWVGQPAGNQQQQQQQQQRAVPFIASHQQQTVAPLATSHQQHQTVPQDIHEAIRQHGVQQVPFVSSHQQQTSHHQQTVVPLTTTHRQQQTSQQQQAPSMTGQAQQTQLQNIHEAIRQHGRSLRGEQNDRKMFIRQIRQAQEIINTSIPGMAEGTALASNIQHHAKNRYDTSEEKMSQWDGLNEHIETLSDLFPDSDVADVNSFVNKLKENSEKQNVDIKRLHDYLLNLGSYQTKTSEALTNGLDGVTEILWLDYKPKNFEDIREILNEVYKNIMKDKTEISKGAEQSRRMLKIVKANNDNEIDSLSEAIEKATTSYKSGCKNCRDLVRNLESLKEMSEQESVYLRGALSDLGKLTTIQISQEKRMIEIARNLARAWKLTKEN